MNSIKVCEYSRSRSFHDDLMLQDQASGERFRTNGPLVLQILCNCIKVDEIFSLHFFFSIDHCLSQNVQHFF